MIKKVFKYSLEMDDINKIEMPIGSEILTVQVQSDTPQIWALVNPNAQNEIRAFRIAGTGHPIEVSDYYRSHRYINSFQLHGGALVFHVFELLP